MAKNILIIQSSLRKNSNSDELAAAFQRGAEEAGNHVQVISLKDKQIAFCKGCLACQSIGHCVIKDDAAAITDAMQQADVIAFATPVYYYGLSGQLKTMLDRANPLFPKDYAFRDIYLLATAADADPEAVHGTQVGLQGWIDCFAQAGLKKVIFAGGVNMPGEIKGHSAMEEAFAAGKDTI